MELNVNSVPLFGHLKALLTVLFFESKQAQRIREEKEAMECTSTEIALQVCVMIIYAP